MRDASQVDDPLTMDGESFMAQEEDERSWDKFLRVAPIDNANEQVHEGWTLIHDGRSLEAALIAAQGELVSDLIWGNLALPITKTLEKLGVIDGIWQTTPDPEQRTEEQLDEEARCRRECREMLELSTNQLEDMMEKKGEFGREYRIVTAGWYMMMLPTTCLRSPLMAPNDASKAAWEFNEKEYERRRAEGTKWRAQREDEAVFDVAHAAHHPYQLTQTRRRLELTITVPVPAKTRPADVRVKTTESHLRVSVVNHPLQPAVIDGDFCYPVRKSDTGGEWHLEGEFETRRLVLDIDKKVLGDWPCLLKADAPPGALEPKPRVKVSGANGDVDVYGESQTVLHRPAAADKFFQWGRPPSKAEQATGARSVQQAEALRAAAPPPPPAAAAPPPPPAAAHADDVSKRDV